MQDIYKKDLRVLNNPNARVAEIHNITDHLQSIDCKCREIEKELAELKKLQGLAIEKLNWLIEAGKFEPLTTIHPLLK